MRGIPVRALRQAATLETPHGVTVWGGTSQAATVALFRVRVERSAGIDWTGTDADVKPLAELYYDARTSLPHGLDFVRMKREAEAVGGALKITYAGQTYAVSLADELLDDLGRVHHYRLEMR